MAILTNTTIQKLAEYKAEFLTARPNIETEDDGTTPKYTDSQWANELVRRFLMDALVAGDQQIKQSSLVEKDFTL